MQLAYLGSKPASGFVMELRGHTLRDQPLSYQSLFSRPFSERFVVMR
jgi:GntR family transcriptional regulator